MARRRDILCQGRGSAANSAVCYCLGVTAVDPARANLLFERFLSVERREPPDIDVDFEHERREEVIQEIYETYGRDRAAMVCEVISYRAKSALREVGKVFGLSLEQVERLAGVVTWWDGMSAVSESRLKAIGFSADDPRVRQTLVMARAIQGFPRHLSIHVGGFVLSATPLEEVAPIEPATMEARTIIPWDKDDIDTLGFFKIDVLGLGMLTAIRKALDLVRDVAAEKPGYAPAKLLAESAIERLAHIPSKDEKVYDALCNADTVGVFQIESRAQMAMLPRLRPRQFYDLVIEVAIVRPGPIQGGMVHPYLRRRTGEEAVRSAASDPRNPSSSARSACRSFKSRSCKLRLSAPVIPAEMPIVSAAIWPRGAAPARSSGIARGSWRVFAKTGFRRSSASAFISRFTASRNMAFPRATPRASRCSFMRARG